MPKSRIVQSLDLLFTKLRRVFARSAIVLYLCGVMTRIENAFQKGHLRHSPANRYVRSTWQYKLSRSVLRASEKSLLLRAFSALSEGLLRTAIGTYALFGVLYGCFSCVVWLSLESGERSLASLVAFLTLIAVCVPLLHVSQSLLAGACSSRFFSWLLFDFCGLSESYTIGFKRGKARPWLVLLISFLLSFAVPMLAVDRVLLFFGGFPVLLLLWSVPELSCLLILFGLPFFNLLPSPTRALTACVLLTELSWLRKAVSGHRELRCGVKEIAVLLFAFAALCGGARGAGGKSSITTGFVFCVLILFWFPAREAFGSARWRERILNALRISCAVTAVWGISQYFLGLSELKWVDLSRFSDLGGRVCGPFTNPNIFAVWLTALMPLYLSGIFEERRSLLQRWLFLLGFALTCLSLILTWSRGAWLGSIAAIFLFLIVHSPRTLSCLTLSTVPLFCSLTFLPHNVIGRFSSIGSLNESSIKYRLYTWQGVLRMIRAHPWDIGCGAEAFSTVYPSYAVSGTESTAHTHQLWLEIAAELGLHGVVIFFVFLILCFLCFFRTIHLEKGRTRGGSLAILCGLIGVLIMGFFDYVWYHFGMIALFFALSSAGCIYREEEES